MTSGFLWALAILGVPTLVLAAGVAACLRAHDDATRALTLPFAYACVVVCAVLAVRLGVRGHALTLMAVGPALIAGAALLVRRGWRGFPPWPLLGAGITLAILAVPYRWKGPGVLGWNVANDSVVHATYAAALGMPDRAPVPGSSADGVVASFAGGYPEGAHAVLAAVLSLSRDPLTTFNPVLALLMAFSAFPAYWLIRRTLAEPPLAAVGAAGAAAGYLQFGFYSQGFMPQMAVTALLFGALALGYEALAAASLWLAAMAGVTAAAAVIVYSAAVGVYLGPAAVLALIALAVMRDIPLRRRLQLPAVTVAAAFVAVLPELRRTLELGRSVAAAAGDATAFVADRGNLAEPVDKLTMLGAWIGPDYRVPYLYIRPTEAAMVAAAGLAAIGVLVALRRQRLALPAVLVVVAAGAAYVASTSGIYYTAKTYQVAAFPIACAVVAGAAALTRVPWRPLLAVPVALAGAVLLGGIGAAFELGIGQAARAAAVTPPELRELQTLRGAMPHRLGLGLIRDDWTKAVLPDVAIPYDGSFGSHVVPGHIFAGTLDIGSIDGAALADVDWIVEQRLGGVASPPAPFRLARTTDTYRLWVRTPDSRPPGAAYPLEPPDVPGGLLLAPGRPLVAPRAGLLEGRAADGALSFPARWALTGSAWGQWVADRSFVVTSPGGGTPASASFQVGAGGSYRIALIGQATAGMRIRVDGADLPPPDPSAGGIVRYHAVGTVRLEPGRHSLSLVAGGNGEIAYILAVSVERVWTSRGRDGVRRRPSRPARARLRRARAPRRAHHGLRRPRGTARPDLAGALLEGAQGGAGRRERALPPCAPLLRSVVEPRLPQLEAQQAPEAAAVGGVGVDQRDGIEARRPGRAASAPRRCRARRPRSRAAGRRGPPTAAAARGSPSCRCARRSSAAARGRATGAGRA